MGHGRSMEIRQMEILCKVIETESFSGAAKAMGLSQPTASEHIKTLESELGTPLFDRLGRTVQPTKAGKVLHKYAKKMLDAREDAKAAIEAYLGVISGQLDIGASTIPGGYLLPHLLGDFKLLHPETSVVINIQDTQKVIEGVLEGTIDLGVTGAKLSGGQLIYRLFTRDELVLAVPPGHALAKKKKIQAQELRGVKMIVREEGSGTRLVADERLHEIGFDMEADQVAAVLGNSQAVRTALKAGVGVAIISQIAVEEDFITGALCSVGIKNFACMREFYSVVHKARTLTPLGRAFLEFIHYERAN